MDEAFTLCNDRRGTRAITLYPIWAWLVIYGGKRIENRTWATRYRGRLAIHAGKRRPAKEENAIREELRHRGILVQDIPRDLPSRQILGTVDLVDVVPYGPDLAGDPFAVGPFCWKLENPRPLSQKARPIACCGRQGFWRLPVDDLPSDD